MLVPTSPAAWTKLAASWEGGNSMLTNGPNWIGEPTVVMFRRSGLDPADLDRLGERRPARNLDLVWWLKLLTGGRLA